MSHCGTQPFTDCPSYPNTKCIIYTGPNLTNINTFTNDRLENILKKINEVIGGTAPSVITLTGDVTGMGTTTISTTVNWDNGLSIYDTYYTPLSRELTINGVTYDLSENRDWIISGVNQNLQEVTDNGYETTTPIWLQKSTSSTYPNIGDNMQVSSLSIGHIIGDTTTPNLMLAINDDNGYLLFGRNDSDNQFVFQSALGVDYFYFNRFSSEHSFIITNNGLLNDIGLIGNPTTQTSYLLLANNNVGDIKLKADNITISRDILLPDGDSTLVLSINGNIADNEGKVNIPVGSVTSVAMTTPIGLTISGSPITSSGTFDLTFTAGYSIPTTVAQTNWDTAYTNRITSLTTTGSSGASTLISNVLNIPTYTLAGLGGQPLSTNLTSLSALTYASTSFVKMTASGTFALDTNTYLTSVGTGITNELTYWSGTNALGSLSTSTYPSLTELSYVKGVTSSIQTQLNAKGTGTVTSIAVSTGTSGTDFNISGSPITTSGTITLNIPDASATARGLITTGVQTIAGAKTFSSTITVATLLGGTATNSTLTLQSTSGVGASGSDIILKVGNNGATEAMRVKNDGSVNIMNNLNSTGSELRFTSASATSINFYPAGTFRGSITSAGNYVFTTKLSVGSGGSPVSTLEVAGSLALAYVAKTANYTATASDYCIDCTSGSFNITLPTAIAITGRTYIIKNSGTGSITISTTNAQTIDGVTTKTLNTQYSRVQVTSTGANWIVTANF